MGPNDMLPLFIMAVGDVLLLVIVFNRVTHPYTCKACPFRTWSVKAILNHVEGPHRHDSPK